MSRSKVHPEKYRTKIRKAKESEPTASLAQINNSFLHDNPNTGNSFTGNEHPDGPTSNTGNSLTGNEQPDGPFAGKCGTLFACFEDAADAFCPSNVASAVAPNPDPA